MKNIQKTTLAVTTIFIGLINTFALETPFTAYKDGSANSSSYTGNSRTLVVRSDTKSWMSHAFAEGAGKGLQNAHIQVYVKDVLHDGMLKVSLSPGLNTLENQTHFWDLTAKDSVGAVTLRAVDHIQHVVDIALSAALVKAIQDNVYTGLVFESVGGLDAELGALEGDHGAVIFLNYNMTSTIVTANVISVDSLANKLFADHSTELRGPAGTNGSNGAKGDGGLNGVQGIKGDKGDKGDIGPQGPIGLPGTPGKDGVAGTAGTGGSTTSLPATAITGLDALLAAKANTATPNFTGSVNIGSANPIYPLEVDLTGVSSDQDTTLGRFIYRIAAGKAASIKFDYRGHSGGEGTIAFREDRANKDFMVVNMLTTGKGQRVVFPNGKVGIGDTLPFGTLSVKGGVATTGNGAPIVLSAQQGAAGNVGGNVTINSGANGNGSNNGSIVFGIGGTTNASGDLINGEKMRIDSLGRIGIGTTRPGNSLTIVKDDGLANDEHGWVSISRDSNVSATNATNPAMGIGYRANGTSPTRVWIRSGNNYPLDLGTTGATQAISILNNGSVGIGDTNSASSPYKLRVNGSSANTTGVWANYSDIRLKRDIHPLVGSLEKVKALQGVTFRWKDDAKDSTYGLQRGFIAQEVEKVIPEWVKTGADGIKSLEKVGVEAVLVEAIKEQQKQIEEQKSEIKNLKSLICIDHPSASICK